MSLISPYPGLAAVDRWCKENPDSRVDEYMQTLSDGERAALARECFDAFKAVKPVFEAMVHVLCFRAEPVIDVLSTIAFLTGTPSLHCDCPTNMNYHASNCPATPDALMVR